MEIKSKEWVPLLVPDMPSPEELFDFLQHLQESKQYSNFGPLVRDLEARFASKFGVDKSLVSTVANATQGLELALQALDLPAGSNVLIPSLTFVATATAVLRAGHRPVLSDVDGLTWMLTPDIARNICNKIKIDAVLPVATFGMPHHMNDWQSFEDDSAIPVVIDAAAAYGSQWLKGARGTLVFSLHTTKSLPAGEGGLVVSTRPDLIYKVRQLSNFGINLDGSISLPVGDLASLGTNAKMSEYHAAVGLISLEKWEDKSNKRRLLMSQLVEEINFASAQSISWQAVGNGGPLMAPTVLCPKFSDKKTRDNIEKYFFNAGVMTRRWYQPLLKDISLLKPHCICLETPNAEVLGNTLLGLPFFLEMNSEQRCRINMVLKKIFH